MNRINNLSSIFHAVIIALFLLSLSGCGYKKAPYYEDKTPTSDENVKFSIKAPSADNTQAVKK